MSKLITKLQHAIEDCAYVCYDKYGDELGTANKAQIDKAYGITEDIHPHVLKMIRIAELQVDLMSLGLTNEESVIDHFWHRKQRVSVECLSEMAVVHSEFSRHTFYYDTPTFHEDIIIYLKGFL